MFKGKNKDTRTTPSVSIVKFGHANVSWADSILGPC